MGFLDFLFGKKNKNVETDSIKVRDASSNTALVTMDTKVVKMQADLFNVHPDIADLIWIANGEYKNFVASESDSKSTFTCNGFTITITMPGSEEPSLIDTRLPIAFDVDCSNVERPPYYPTYIGLSSEQKGVYWQLLSNPYNPSIDIGFVFVLYYGLERFLLGEKHEKAFNVIHKLREVHANNSFQFYSTNALILTAIIRNRPDLLTQTVNISNNESEKHGVVNLLLLSKLLMRSPLTTSEIISFAKPFGLSSNNYIKNYPELFEVSLKNTMIQRFGIAAVEISNFVDIADLKNMPTETIPIFANTSIRDKMVTIPNLKDSPNLKLAMFELLKNAHESVKTELANLRKSGKVPAKKESPEKPKKILSFDSVAESNLISEFKKSKFAMNRHFAMLQLQDFYYKYRDVDGKYLELCIEYCLKDIASLDDVQKCHYTEENQRINRLKDVYSSAEIKKEMSEISAFMGRIPAFSRLAIIYEKKKDTDKAVDVCQQAISYYSKYDMSHMVEEFENRIEKLLKKTMR